ncbi:hypothetical protein LCGC14_0687260 [marine sediment metagenome]|uniref:Uncharacterized protein n=1 Tax=marine sediment metagenome TaxID=412755 RepID=A0A0F9QRB1_9ZZZZ
MAKIPGKQVSLDTAAFQYLLDGDIDDAQLLAQVVDSLGANHEPMGFPNVTDTTIGWDNSTKIFTLAKVGASFSIWIHGREHVFTADETIDISGSVAEGLWYFYYASDGVLTASQALWSLSQTAPVALLYWDATNSQALIFADERHGLTMPWATHGYLHDTVRTLYASGLGLAGDVTGNGNVAAHAQVAIDDGVLFDEDLLISIADGTTARFEQPLTPIAQLPVFWLLGATPVWRSQVADDFPVKQGTNRIQYNLFSAGSWSAVDAPSNGNYVAVWVFGSNNYSDPVFVVLGQHVDNKLSDAQQNNTLEGLSLASLPIDEMKPLYRLIFQTSAVYGNTPHARLRDIADYRIVQGVPGVWVSTSHNSIAGRSVYPAHPFSAIELDVEEHTEGVGAPHLLVDDDRHKVMTNEGSTAENYHTLPTATEGLSFTFVCQDVDGIRITAATGDTIRVGDYVSVAAGAIRSVRVGASIELVAINATEWVAVDTVGAWQVEVSGGVFTYATRSFDIEFTFQNSGAVLNTGAQDAAYTECGVDAVIESVYCYGGQLNGDIGSIVVDLWADEYANYPPTVADTICAAAKPTIAAAVKSEDTTLAGWTKELARGDGVLPNIDSVTDLVWAKVVLRCKER